jgi:hypothetical protein
VDAVPLFLQTLIQMVHGSGARAAGAAGAEQKQAKKPDAREDSSNPAKEDKSRKRKRNDKVKKSSGPEPLGVAYGCSHIMRNIFCFSASLSFNYLA